MSPDDQLRQLEREAKMLETLKIIREVCQLLDRRLDQVEVRLTRLEDQTTGVRQ